jgi:hypothetical protein
MISTTVRVSGAALGHTEPTWRTQERGGGYVLLFVEHLMHEGDGNRALPNR